MASKVFKNGDNTNSQIVELIADTREDIESLSVEYGSGSTCLCIEDSSVWVLGVDPKTWNLL